MFNNYFLVINLIISLVYGKLSDITRKCSRERWLSDDDFDTLLTTTFEFSVCCNVFIEGDSERIDVIFDQFKKIYKSDYVIQTIYPACEAYFVIGSDEYQLVEIVKKLPVSNPSTEIVIFIDHKVNRTSPLLSTSLYSHANVNVVTASSLWSLSVSYLLPRIFLRDLSYASLSHRSDTIDFHGRELQVGTYDIRPFSFLPHEQIRNTTTDKTQDQFFRSDEEIELMGVEFELFLIMAQKMNFRWTIRRSNSKNALFGRGPVGDVKDGLVGRLLKNELNLVFGAVWLTEDSYDNISLTYPWYQVFISFLVPRPKPIINFWALIKPFPWRVWLMLILSIVVQSLSIWSRARVNPNIPARLRSYINTQIEMIGRLVGFWLPKKILGVRVQLQLWHFCGLLIVTAYCSDLAARLTTPSYEPRINTVEQFIKANLTWGRERPLLQPEVFFDMQDEFARQMPGRFRYESSPTDRHRQMAKGKYAIFGRTVHSKFFPESYVNYTYLDNYRLMKNPVGQYQLSFAVQPWLVFPLNAMIQRLTENGLTEYHLQKVIDRNIGLHLREVLIERDGTANSKPVPLMSKSLGAAFTLLFASHIIAVIVFLFELRSHSSNKGQSVRKVF